MALTPSESSQLDWSVAIAIPWLFLPAILGLSLQIWQSAMLDEQCILWALLLLCIDQARMAQVDLKNIATVRAALAQANRLQADSVQADFESVGKIQTEPRLHRFYWVTLSTIAIELIGFYWTAYWTGPEMAPIAGGAILVLLSQLWFHGLAGVQLFPEAAEPTQEFGVLARSPVLIADTIGIILLVLWSFNIASMGMAIALLTMVGLYGFAKYGLPILLRFQPKHSS